MNVESHIGTRIAFSIGRLFAGAALSLMLLLMLVVVRPAHGQSADGLPAPKQYRSVVARNAPVIDGRLDDPAWKSAAWTSDFIDIEGPPPGRAKPRFRTRAKMAWDSDFLYFAAELEEPHVWGTLREHDSVIFHDNDFEVFIDPDGDTNEYYEFEINALNTGWDLFLNKPYKSGGKALDSWGIPGLQTAIHVNGTLNDPRDKDRGWTIEIAMPWKVLAEYAHKPAPPVPGDKWRINFSRVEWRHEIVDGKYQKVKGLKEDNWVWSPQWRIDMHAPQYWGVVEFVR